MSESVEVMKLKEENVYLKELCDKQKHELRELDERFRSMARNFDKMKAQLDIVYLIFGGGE